MPLKIYYNHDNPFFFHSISESNTHRYHSLYINFEKEKWILTDDMSEADIIPAISYQNPNDPEEIKSAITLVKSLLKPNQILLIISVFHCDDWVSALYYRELGKNYFEAHPRTIFVHTNTLDNMNPRFICYNIVFNRQKYYMTSDAIDPEYMRGVWLNSSYPEMFKVKPIIEKPFDHNYKHLMCPNRIIWESGVVKESRNYYKFQLSHLLLNSHDSKKYYLSDPDKGSILEPNGWNEYLKSSNNTPPINKHGTWFPISDYYYETSYASVFIESILGGNVFHDFVVSPTEKFFDPLIKGHFPIGFSAPGTIKCLKDLYGFKFPDWIDYSYDNILDRNDRFHSFLNSINAFLNIPLEQLHELYVNDIDILKHNQRIFFDKPYYYLHDKVEESIKQLGWQV